MISAPPLLIISRLAADFDLVRLPWPEAADGRISVSRSKFADLDMIEVIIDGMAFLLCRFTPTETRSRFRIEKFEQLFTGLPSTRDCAIGVAARNIVASARHLPEINRRMLLLGKWVGESLAASAAAWTPSRRIASFRYFQESVDAYLAGGPFPALFQTAFAKVGNRCFITRGLPYFGSRDIRLTGPSAYSDSDIVDRMVRIIDDIANHGPIEMAAQAKGMIEGERIIFSPRDDPARLDIRIENPAFTGDPARI